MAITDALLNEPLVTEGEIQRFESDDHRLLRPITVRFERSGRGYVARFDEANFAISGTTKQDAFQALETEILDAFDDWTGDESILGPGPRQQLAVLRNYIERC
jgi:hypothetical protein